MVAEQIFEAVFRRNRCMKVNEFIAEIWAMSWENLFIPCANNKDADQPSLITVFVIRFLDSIISVDRYILNCKTVASLGCWAGQFESYLVANPKDMFSCDEAHISPKTFLSQFFSGNLRYELIHEGFSHDLQL